MGSPILPDDILADIADLERRLRVLESTSRRVAGGLIGIITIPADVDFTNVVGDVAGLSVPITIGPNRRLRISFHCHVYNHDFAHAGGNNTARIQVMEGAVELARRSSPGIADATDTNGNAARDIDGTIFITPTAGAHTYNLRAQVINGPSQLMTIVGGATDTAFISVEDMGSV